jgi:hypothetical protein
VGNKIVYSLVIVIFGLKIGQDFGKTMKVYCTLRRTLREDEWAAPTAAAAAAAAPQAPGVVLRFKAKGNSGGMEHTVMVGMILKSLGS